MRRRERPAGEKLLQFSWRDTLLTLLALALAIGLSALCRYFDPEGDSYAPMLFLFAVALVSRLTRGYFYGVAAAVLSVFAQCGANILTINQSIPVSGCATITISAETAGMSESMETLMNRLVAADGVIRAEILAG